jgi:hypothetical protein
VRSRRGMKGRGKCRTGRYRAQLSGADLLGKFSPRGHTLETSTRSLFVFRKSARSGTESAIWFVKKALERRTRPRPTLWNHGTSQDLACELTGTSFTPVRGKERPFQQQLSTFQRWQPTYHMRAGSECSMRPELYQSSHSVILPV